MRNCRIESIVFISNYFNHHQKAVSDALYSRFGEAYTFIETSKMSEERKRLGYKDLYEDYVVKCEDFYQNKENYQKRIDAADVVIFGSAPSELLKNRMDNNELVFRYAERIFKKGFEIWKYPIRFLKLRKSNPNKENLYMLSASAYTSFDFSRFGLYRNKCYKWGYFPITKIYSDIDKMIIQKQAASILWAGRLIDYKHPEAVIYVARELKKAEYSFSINVIGVGPLEKKLRKQIDKEGLGECVHMLGAMSPEQVREYMEQSEIFLFTSDRQEGWGAVLNESMNSSCAVVASHIIGSAPFLIRNGKNGLLYNDGNMEDLFEKVKWLLDNKNLRVQIARNAYFTIKEEWNADVAVDRFIRLSESILNGEKNPDVVENGVCSKAHIMKENWLKE